MTQKPSKLAYLTVASATPLLAGAVGLLLSTASGPASASPTQPGELQQPLTPSDGCGTCHEFFSTADQLATGGSVDPWAWRASLMGNSARDPVFWAGLALARQDHPDEAIDCVRCHVPRAFLDGQGEVESLDELSVDQREGIDCDFCHRMQDDGVTPPGNARYVLADAPEGEEVPRYGPWSYDGPEPQHPWAQDLEFLPSSRMCGVCHDVSTGRERVDDNGVGLGVPFNEQRTYSEWLNSSFAQADSPEFASCQSCHQPAIEGEILGCNMFAGLPHPSGGSRHILVGANVPTLRVLQHLYGDAGTGEIADSRFEETLAWTEEFAATAATLEVEFPTEVDASAGLPQLPVTVTNQSGHKLPSGYSEGRVMWLEVTARYAGTLVWSSGRWDPETTSIEADEQVRRYEALAQRWSDGKKFHLTLNDHWLVDSRIPPKGLTPDLETDPVGDRYLLQDDGTWPHFDRHSYSFAAVELEDATPGVDDSLELSVRLLYLVNTPEYLELLLEDNVSNQAGTFVVDSFAAADAIAPVVLAEATASVPLRGLGEGEGGADDPDQGGDDPDQGDADGGDSSTESGETATGPAVDAAGDGCGCATRSGQAGGVAVWLMLVLVARRRRVRARA